MFESGKSCFIGRGLRVLNASCRCLLDNPPAHSRKGGQWRWERHPRRRVSRVPGQGGEPAGAALREGPRRPTEEQAPLDHGFLRHPRPEDRFRKVRRASCRSAHGCRHGIGRASGVSCTCEQNINSSSIFASCFIEFDTLAEALIS